MKYIPGKVSSHQTPFPVVASRNRSRKAPQSWWEGRPDDDEVEMAGVIAKVDTLCVGVRIAPPLYGGAGDQMRRGRERACYHVALTLPAMRRVRLTIVTMDPATIVASPT